MLRKTALFSALLLAAGSPLVAGASAYEQKVKASLALIGYPVDDKRLTIAFGTGFCVNSSAAKSYYVTNNHVVTDRPGNLAPNLFLIQAKAPGTRLKATVLRHSVDPDLAIVAVDAPCDGTVKLSRSVPEEGDEIAIAGFPYVEVCEEAGLCSPSLLAPDAHKGKLGPILSPGHVNEAQEGTYSIIYDAKADHGNSGGPLFDAQSGVVYGIVVDVLPGYADEGAPPSTTYNRAIAMGVGLPFINGAPVTVALDAAPGGQRGGGGVTDRYASAALGSPACRTAWRSFDQAYGEWAQAHGRIVSLADFLAQPANAARKDELQPLEATLAAHESDVLGRLRTSFAAMQSSGATSIVKPAGALVDAVAASTAEDAAPGSGSAAKADAAAATRLKAAAQAMDSVSACL